MDKVNDFEEYKRKIKKQKQTRYLRVILIVALILIAVLAVKLLIDKRSYDHYKVIEKDEQIDSSVLHYKELGDYVFRYSGDGVSLLNRSNRVVWNDSIQMTAPMMVSFDKVVALYETKGTEVHIYGLDGKLGKIKTEHPILKASVSGLGGVGVILENGENTLINYYAADGGLIASSSTNMRNPGYPVDLSVSENGMSLAVTYFVTDEDGISSYLAFYNFGEVGKNKEDNLLDGFRFEGILVPKVQYINDNTLVVYREDGFSVYKESNLVKEVKNITFEEQIVSSFSDGELFGFVFSDQSSVNDFELRLYDALGNQQLKCGFDFIYDKIKISGDQIILHNASQFSVIGTNGVVRYSGNFEEGKILDIVKRGINRYDIACDKGIVSIELT